MTSDPAAAWIASAREQAGVDYAHVYADRFDALAASGRDIHGEANFIAGIVPEGSRILDAGCGTGRVASRLVDLGYRAVGVDVDAAMVAVARERRGDVEWHVSDLSTLELGVRFDVVVSCGNVVPFIDASRLPAVATSFAKHLAPGGLLVCGFGLDRAHLPTGAAIVPLSAYHQACAAASLHLEATYAGWEGTPFADDGYAVSLHRLTV